MMIKLVNRINQAGLVAIAVLSCFLLMNLYIPEAKAVGASDVERELHRLPAICRYKIAPFVAYSFAGSENWSPKVRMANEWGYKQYGHAWFTMHHYCWALVRTLEAAEAVGRGRSAVSALTTAIIDFGFVIRNAKPPYTEEYIKLEAELHYRMGRAYEGLNDDDQAALAYIRAIKRNPAYEEAYAAYSDLYRRLGLEDDAREILENGLEEIPDSSMLARRLEELSQEADSE